MRRKAVLAMASTASAGIGLFAVVWLATRRLTAAELGYFFAFLSLGSFVQLADFGLSFASLQTGGRLVGTSRLHELPSVAKRVRRWNLATASVATIIVASVGWAIFSSRASLDASRLNWHGPWLGYLTGVFGSQLSVPGTSLREGTGKVSQMWRLRLVQEWAGGFACLLALQLGAGLWSLSAFATARALVGGAWLLIGDPFSSVGVTAFPMKRWMSEVWPFQWKLGLSGLSGFLIFRAFTPIVLLEKGPVLAGEFGIAISMMNLLIAVTTAWPLSYAARYSAVHAEGKFGELRREFPKMLWWSTLLSAIAALALDLALWKARGLGVTFALRFPDFATTSMVLSCAIVHHVVACFAVFLRTEGREPLLVPSVVGGIITVSLIWLAARYGGLQDIALVNLACALAGVPIAVFLVRSRERAIRLLDRGEQRGKPNLSGGEC